MDEHDGTATAEPRASSEVNASDPPTGDTAISAREQPEPMPEPPLPQPPEPAPEPPQPGPPTPEPPALEQVIVEPSTADAVNRRAERTGPQAARRLVAQKPRTKLVCTIGPATAARVRELVEAGMDVARINFSHGIPDEHKQAVDAVRSGAHSFRRSVAVLVDLPGPKIRLGELEGGETSLEAGRPFVLRPPGSDGERPGGVDAAEVTDPRLAADLRPGDRILLADGAAELTVRGTSNGEVQTEVVRGGVVRSRTGVNVPAERLSGPALTEADRLALPRALQLKADLIAQSFVRSADDVRELRALLPEGLAAPQIVAKIETRAAVESFDDIVEVCDGVMVARGDLGVDLPFEDVPLVQKALLRRARERGRFTIVATQMLESMTAAPRPTRAEASDVANAVLDGTDAVMLSAETAIGEYPIEACQAALGIAAATEREMPPAVNLPGGGMALPVAPETDAEAVVHAAVELTLRYPPSAIWCFTRSGRTAEMLSILRPRLPIVAFTATPTVARRLAVRGGVVPVVLPTARTGEPLIRRMEAAARAQGVARSGAGAHGASVLLVTTSAQPGGINRLEIHEI